MISTLPHRKHLPLVTFLSVFFSIVVVGAVVMPLVLSNVERAYINLQADVNERQSKAMAQFIESRAAHGDSRDMILKDFEATIQGSNTDRGFVCLVDQKTADFLCHPQPELIGKPIALRMAVYDTTFTRSHLVPWEQAIKNPSSTSGLLLFDNLKSEEVVHSEVISSLGWVVNSHENTARIRQEIDHIRTLLVWGSLAFAFILAFPISLAARTVSRRYERQIEAEQEKADRLLLSILPAPIAGRMKNGEKSIVDRFGTVAILFCDIAGFTRFSSSTSPGKVVELLNRIFSKFDELCHLHGVEKIKTIGDAYMAVCGLPSPSERPVENLAALAFDMVQAVSEVAPQVQVRIGIHVGEVVAGVIGNTKFSYDLWGDAVNLASRLESSGVVGRVHVSSEVKNALGEGEWIFEDQGEKELKGKGLVRTWLLARR